MPRGREGSLAELDNDILDVGQAANVQHGRERAKETKRRKVNLQGIRRDITAAEIAAAHAAGQLADERHKVTNVDVSVFGESMAARKGRKKAEEHITADDTKGFFGFFRKAFRRQTASGQEDKFRKQAAEEIFTRGHLAASKEKSYEIVDEAVEYVEDASMRAAGENPEIFTGPRGAALDAAGAGVVSEYVLGDIQTRDEFEVQFKERILPFFKTQADINTKIYGSDFFYIAEGYKKQFEEKLEMVSQQFGPEQRAIVQTYVGRVFRMDVSLAKVGTDMYEMKSNSSVLRGLEMALNAAQSPILSTDKLSDIIKRSKYKDSKVVKAIDRALGLTMNNPVLIAYIGNRLGYAAASGLGVGAVKVLGLGAATAASLGPGMMAAAGAAAGAGVYLGIRAAVEHWRGIKRRHEQAALGQGPEETSQRDARAAANKLYKITEELGRAGVLTDQQQSDAARIIATLETQDKLKKNLFSVGEGEGAAYDTNFAGVQDLRRAINGFKSMNSMQRNPIDIDTLKAVAEKEILAQVKEKESQLLAEVKRRGLWAGAKGAGVTFAAACLAPGLKQAAEMGWNKFMDFVGVSKLHFDTSKLSFTEEIWHNVKEKLHWGEHYKLYDPGEGMQRLPMGTVGGKTGHFFDIPDNRHLGDLQFVKSPDAKFLIISQRGVDFVKIPIDVDGHVTDETPLIELRDKYGWSFDRLTETLPGTVGASVSATGGTGSWVNKFGHHPADPNVEVAQIHTKGLYDNSTPGDSDFNELRLHVTKQTNGDTLVDCKNLLGRGSFRVVGSSIEQPDMLALRSAGELKFAFVPDGGNPQDAILLSMDSAGNAIVPKGAWYRDLILDPSSGNVRQGVLFGTVRVDAGTAIAGSAMKSYNVFWANADHGASGMKMDFSNIATGSTAATSATEHLVGFRLRPPVYHDFGGPIALAGDRRRTDANVMSDREKRAEKKRLKDRAEFRKKMLKEHPEAEERLILAQEELVRRIKNGELADVAFKDVVDKYVLENDLERQEILFRRTCQALGMSEAQIAAAVLAKKQAFEASHAGAVAGGGGSAGGGGGGGIHGAETHGTSQPAAVAGAARPQFNQKAAWFSILTEAQRASRNPKEKGNREYLEEINRRTKYGPRITFDADEALVVGGNFAVTNRKADAVYEFIKDQNLDPNFYQGTWINIKFSENGLYDIVTDLNAGSITIPVAPNLPSEAIGEIILNRLKMLAGAEGKLKFKQEFADRSFLDSLNTDVNNQYPHLEFAVNSEDLLKGESKNQVNRLVQGVFNRVDASGLRGAGKYKVGEVRVQISNESDGRVEVKDGSIIVHAKPTDSPQSVFSRLESQLSQQAKEEKPDHAVLDALNARAGNENPSVQFAVANEDLLKGDLKKRVENLAIAILAALDTSGLRDYKHRDTIFKIDIGSQGNVTRDEGYFIIPVSLNDTAGGVFNKIRAELRRETGEDISDNQPDAVRRVNADPNNKEPHFDFNFDKTSIRKIPEAELVNYLSDLYNTLRTNQDIAGKRFTDAIINIKLVNVKEPPDPKMTGGVIEIAVKNNLSVKAAERVIITAMKSLVAPEAQPKVNKDFLVRINGEANNRDPYINYQIPDDSLVRQMGRAKAEAYVKLVATQVRAKVEALIVAAPAGEKPNIQRQRIKVRIMSGVPYRGFRDSTDRTYVITFPPNATGADINDAFDTQYEDAKQNYRGGGRV